MEGRRCCRVCAPGRGLMFWVGTLLLHQDWCWGTGGWGLKKAHRMCAICILINMQRAFYFSSTPIPCTSVFFDQNGCHGNQNEKKNSQDTFLHARIPKEHVDISWVKLTSTSHKVLYHGTCPCITSMMAANIILTISVGIIKQVGCCKELFQGQSLAIVSVSSEVAETRDQQLYWSVMFLLLKALLCRVGIV